MIESDDIESCEKIFCFAWIICGLLNYVIYWSWQPCGNVMITSDKTRLFSSDR